MHSRGHLWVAAALVLMLAQPCAAQAQPDSVEAKLFSLSQALLQDPQNPKLLLQKGVLLLQTGQLQAAQDVFQTLRQAHPNHPAPYTNLASVFARQGKLEEARQMLMKADELQSNKYQTQLSLASVNLELAAAALAKANQINPEDKGTEMRLRMLERYLSDVNRGNGPAASATRLADAPAAGGASSARGSAAPATLATVKSPRDRLLLGLTDPRDDRPAPEAAPKPEGALPLPVKVAADPRQTEVLKMVELWVAAWTRRSFDDYAALYSRQFSPSEGVSRDEWSRRKRLLWAKTQSIQVELKISGIRFAGDQATVNFLQKYRSDQHADVARKELRLVMEDGQWKILTEKKKS